MAFHSSEIKSQLILQRTPAEYCDFCLGNNESLVLKLLYALAWGRLLFTPSRYKNRSGSTSQNDLFELSMFLAVCVAKGMVERVITQKPGPLQLMVGDTLSMINAPKHIREFLSRIRLATDRWTMDMMVLNRAVHNMLEKVALTLLDTFLLSHGNFGLKGKKDKWAQHTIIQKCVISEKKLCRLVFYNNNQISREQKNFKDFLEDYDGNKFELAKSIVEPNISDYNALKIRVMKAMKTAARLDMPSPDDCREIFESNGAIQCQHQCPSNFCVTIYTCGAQKTQGISITDCVSTDLYPKNG